LRLDLSQIGNFWHATKHDGSRRGPCERPWVFRLSHYFYRRMLDEIWACAREHLKSLDLSRSPRGVWYCSSKQIASRRIDAIVGKLKPEPDPFGGIT
jgi:hypothetical protein